MWRWRAALLEQPIDGDSERRSAGGGGGQGVSMGASTLRPGTSFTSLGDCEQNEGLSDCSQAEGRGDSPEGLNEWPLVASTPPSTARCHQHSPRPQPLLCPLNRHCDCDFCLDVLPSFSSCSPSPLPLTMEPFHFHDDCGGTHRLSAEVKAEVAAAVALCSSTSPPVCLRLQFQQHNTPERATGRLRPPSGSGVAMAAPPTP